MAKVGYLERHMRHIKSRAITKGSALPEAERRRLADLVDQVGEREAVGLLGCNRQTLARCLGGLGVYPGTVALIRDGLARVRLDDKGEGGR